MRQRLRAASRPVQSKLPRTPAGTGLRRALEPRSRRNGLRLRISAARYNRDLVTYSSPSATIADTAAILYGRTLRRNFGMGLSELEAGLLSRETGPEEVSRLLLDTAQYCRSKLHVPATRKRDHGPELDSGHARGLSLRREGASGNHAHQAAEGDGRFHPAISDDD